MLSDDSGSPPPSTTVGHLPRSWSRYVTRTVQSVTAYSGAEYAAPTWRSVVRARQIGAMTAPATHQHPVTVRTFTQRLSPTPRGARLARHLALNQLHAW